MSTPIIAPLCAVEAREKGLARRVACWQAATAPLAAAIVYGLWGTVPDALGMLAGGGVSAINGALLAWRMPGPEASLGREAHDPSDAHRQLRRMYFYAAERFLTVVLLLGLCMATLALPPLAVVGGFVTGQTVFLLARLFLNRSNMP